jgi:tetratricopeptide (TPR) repeat protein
MRRQLITSGLALALCTPVAATAQDQFIKPTPHVVELTSEGMKALESKDYERAVKAFESATIEQGLNITYLNYGRALYYAGRCHDAEEAYKRARLTSLKIAKPEPKEVEAKAAQYIGELYINCPAELTIQCKPRQMMVSIDKGAEAACPDRALKLEKGDHTVRGTLEGQETEQRISLRPMDKQTVSLSIKVVEKVVEREVIKEVPVEKVVEREVIKEVPADPKTTLPTPENTGEGKQGSQVVINVGQQDKAEPNSSAAWLNLGIGAGLLVTGGVVDYALSTTDAANHRNGASPQTSDWLLYSTPIVMYFVGTILAINGLTKF